MEENQTKVPLTEEDIIDLNETVNHLREFVGELTGILYDNTGLPEDVRSEIEQLYRKCSPKVSMEEGEDIFEVAQKMKEDMKKIISQEEGVTPAYIVDGNWYDTNKQPLPTINIQDQKLKDAIEDCQSLDELKKWKANLKSELPQSLWPAYSLKVKSFAKL